MNYVGIDIGSSASKVVVRGEKAQQFVMPTGWSGRETAGVIQARLEEDGIDVGGQDTKVLRTQNGAVTDFLMNDKCSAGTGKFLEIMANRLGIALDELFELAAQGTALPISSRAEGKGDTCSWGLLYLFSPGDRHGYGGGSCRALFHI